MLDTPTQTEEHRPDGLNVLASLLQEIQTLKNVSVALMEENKALRETVQAHEERLNNLTLNIPDATLNAIMARTLDMHAQVLMAATRPQPTPQEQEASTPEETEIQEEG